MSDSSRSSIRDSAASDDPPFDANELDVAVDASYVAPCLRSGYVFYVEGDSDADGLGGPESVTAATGSWSASLTSGSLLLVQVDAPSPWNFEIIDFNSANGITAGTSHFIGGTFGEMLNVDVPGAECENGWTGDLQIEELVVPDSDQATINRLFATFQLECSGQSLSGCVSYGN